MRERKHTSDQQTEQAADLPKLLLTYDAVCILQEALLTLDTVFIQNKRPLPNLEFGKEVLYTLLQKVTDMLQSQDWDNVKPFDYNELHMLYAALHMYLVELSLRKEQEQVLACLALCKQITRVVETVAPRKSSSSIKRTHLLT